ncbi:MAG: bifunctional diaminohydroxyphosphoribosylaminopyrimidine deaminase/5-amino-6-(5-phosphoribosylamino)uracil reductase RibD [Neomegalonema sp.]|nr:bifunctional diaminohydroxyphosphoribosylaminopyrimidine deaminase/5-amino-6-(5-phosphoribosylamino)uracil reductase RibD [Neomegalonema sp.]
MSKQNDAELDRRFMRAALHLSQRGLGGTGSNPSVGCIIVGADGRVLGRGVTAPGGRPHAEMRALRQAQEIWGDAAQELLRDATAYVTLEPCSHHGKTPPCAIALGNANIRRAVIAIEDPDPRVSGRGLAQMRAAGVQVEIGTLADQARDALGGYLRHRSAGRPRMTLKLASTLDGRIATATGESRWISCAAARMRAHAIRAASDVILVGSGTARADDPALNVRIPGLEASSPARAVADATLRTPLDGKLMRSAKQLPLYLLHAADAPAERREACASAGAQLIEVPRGADGALDPAAMLGALGRYGHIEAMCEGGGKLSAALLKADLVDRLVWVQAGIAIGAEGRPALGQLMLDRLAAAPSLELVHMEPIGCDVLTEWRRRS